MRKPTPSPQPFSDGDWAHFATLSVYPSSRLGQFGYGLLLGRGDEGGRGKPAYQTLIESIIAWRGEDATPALLRRELEGARIDGRVRQAMMLQLQRLETIVSPEHHLVDKLERGWPVLVYLESRYLGADQILPLEVALMNALSRPLRSGADPHRWLLLDELNLHVGHEGMEVTRLEREHNQGRPFPKFTGRRKPGRPVGS